MACYKQDYLSKVLMTTMDMRSIKASGYHAVHIVSTKARSEIQFFFFFLVTLNRIVARQVLGIFSRYGQLSQSYMVKYSNFFNNNFHNHQLS